MCRAVAKRAILHSLCLRSALLSHDLSCVEFYQHSSICFDLFYRHRESKVVQKKELKFEVVKFW